MRASWFMLSLFLHAVAIVAAVCSSAFLAQASPSVPRVELQTSVAQQVVPPPVIPVVTVVREAPPVLVEASLAEVKIVEEFVEPDADLPADDSDALDAPGLRAWSLVPVRRSAAKVPPVPEPAVEPGAEPVAPTEPAATERAPDVEAAPLADNAPPEYPEPERLRGHEGTVRVLVFVDEAGAVLAAELAEASSHPGLNRAALRAVRKWRFSPARRDGLLAAGTTEVVVEFRLTGG